ncbi:TonB-dependent receptor plug domain-containing protein [Niabella drilacis]|uniref:TonB-linked outer membrane protein, SusC/RagA family n=1 Tax=Niabella drilacis (strain DSM 25811 / CCM 8410 / CCUG 62505 / LMG 26954 / E90) TaxID=1285928 RepID=A0A1G7B4C7_NIADE|nr:TonB-dependent receptor plug domain-containing protein [Niabella drilacis]SDE21863.1 TonB-linked outer membrane protein, SusC/RagA family [Niabella drilacis]
MRIGFIGNLRRGSLLAVLLMACCVVFAQEDSTATAGDSVKLKATAGITLAAADADSADISVNKVPLKFIQKQPYVSVQQMLKGNVAGVYVQEPSGEPGTEQNIFVHGIGAPLLNKKDLFEQQAAVFINGIPLIRENPFAYEVQKFDINRIGPATNLYSILNADNIKSIEVIKDPASLGFLGPMAANGAIWITTENARPGKSTFSVNAYTGVVPAEKVTPLNANYENQFRTPFYDRYATLNDRLRYPAFLRDSTNANYYGPSDWTDLYYKNTPVYAADFSLSGGVERANFRFFGSAMKNASDVDNTSLSRYAGSFFINVAPVKWLMVSSMINFTRLARERNRNIRDRIAEQGYIPDLTNPLTPNKSVYGSYLGEFGKVVDDNISNSIQGYLALSANIGKVNYDGRLAFDYNENMRDAFWPTTLLEGNNFVSAYFGYNQRILLSNTLGYTFDFSPKQSLTIKGGQSVTSDVNKYEYASGFNGPNDFIKINMVNGDPSASDYLIPKGFQVKYYPARMESALVSFFGNAIWKMGDALSFNAIVRRDGSSFMQPDSRWFTSYSGALEWNITEHLLTPGKTLSALKMNASWGRLGKLLSDDRFSGGAIYRVDMGWSGEPAMGSYVGIPGLTRPYTSGWVGYGMPWAYNDKLMVGLNAGLLDNRIQAGVAVYNRDDKQTLLPIPVASEWGYTGVYKPGLVVNNKGLDLSVNASILEERAGKLGWVFNANLNYNRNEVTALPDGLQELVLGTSKLETGKPVDAFWMFENNGIYASDNEVPLNPNTNKPLSYRGMALKAGDPRWTDQNNDYVIDEKDKVLAGNYMPKLSGGFGSTLTYGAFNLDFQFYYVGGRNVLNQYAANRLDFVNVEANNDINSVKEITFWEKKMDLSGYPQYNPWSSVLPYRADQDLFLDNASFLKLRTVSLGYDFSKAKNPSKFFEKFRQSLVYITGTNLLTVTKFKGDDPELADYNGVYTGFGLRMPRSVIVGFRLNF